MKRKIVSAITALGCMASMAMGASAQVDFIQITDTLIAINESGLYDHLAGFDKGVLVQTDGTVLTEDMVSAIDGVTGVQSWEDYTSGWTANGEPDTEALPGGNGYMVCLDTNDPDTLNTVGRVLLMGTDCITDAFLVEFMDAAPVVLPTVPEFIARPADPETELSEASISGFEEFSCTSFSSYKNSYVFTLENPDTSQFLATMNEADLATDYETYCYLQAFADEILSLNSSLITSIEPSYYIQEIATDYGFNVTSVWSNAGDQNADGTVDAADAADVLAVAAQVGAGAAAPEDVVTSVCDVNADGAADAADAAAILQYAAALGSGREVSWMDILR